MANILLGINNQSDLKFLKEVISQLGHRILCFDQTQKIDREVDLFIIDEFFLRQYGDTIKNYKTQNQPETIPVLLLTTRDQQVYKFMDQDFINDFVKIPVRSNIFKTRIKNLLRIRSDSHKLKTLNQQLNNANEDLHASVAEKEQLIRELEKRGEELKGMNEEKKRLFSIIGHDLKNPINNAVSLLDILYDGNEIQWREDSGQMLHLLSNQIYHVRTLMEEILMWSRAQMDRLQLQMESLNMKNLADEIIELVDNEARNKNITIQNYIPQSINCHADYFTISTVLRNLVTNAIKFTHPEGNIDISAEENCREYHFAVSDKGVGIPPEIQDQLFRTDFKTTTKGTNNESGTGLGLSICKEFVEKNAGKIWVNSKLNEGTTFYFSLPV